MDNLFYIYLKLYPVKADPILDAICSWIESADALDMTGKDRNAVIDGFILESYE